MNKENKTNKNEKIQEEINELNKIIKSLADKEEYSKANDLKQLLEVWNFKKTTVINNNKGSISIAQGNSTINTNMNVTNK
jgi:hypothetical protein